MAINQPKSSTTIATTLKSGLSKYGTATYGAWSYDGTRIPTNSTKSSVTITMQAKS